MQVVNTIKGKNNEKDERMIMKEEEEGLPVFDCIDC